MLKGAPSSNSQFLKLELYCSEIRGAVQSLPREQAVGEEQGEDSEFEEVYEAILTRMREAGYEGTSFEFVPQVQEIVGALMELGSISREDLTNGNIDQIIELHQETRGVTAHGRRFEDIIRRLVESNQEENENDDTMEEDE